jgi:hypothetical protein
MGYTISRASVKRNKEQLEQLLKMKQTLVFKNIANPTRLAHKLREAIAAAGEFDEFKHLAELKTMYRFRTGANTVIAQYEVAFVEPEPLKKDDTQDPKPVAPEKKTMPDALNAMDVVGAAMKFSKEHEIHFPNAVLVDEDRIKLWRWTQEVEWNYIDHDGAGLTLTKKDIPEEVKWQPANSPKSA